MIVSNSSPLIFLAKLALFDQVKKLYPAILIPPEVHDEVIVHGKKEGFSEVLVLEKHLKEGYLKIVDVKEKNTKNVPSGLHLGEVRAIQLCLEQKLKMILLDDKEAIAYARILGLEPIRTTRLLFELTKNKHLPKEQFKDALIRLSQEGYFLTIDVYTYLLEEVEKN